MLDFSKLYVRPQDSLRVVMQCISGAALSGLPSGIALVISEDEVLKGVVTDGDIRRGLLAGVSLDDPVEKIYSRDPIVFSSNYSYREVLDEIPRRLVEKGRYRGGVLEKVILVNDAGCVDEVLDFLEVWRNQMALHRHVAIVGLGYVGLTLAVTLAEAGFQVSGVEANTWIRELLMEGRPHFHEVGLEPLFNHHLGKKLTISPHPPQAAEIYILAVATPIGADQKPNLKDLQEAAQQVGSTLSYGDLVVLRSTCPVGSCRNVVLPILEKTSGMRCGRDFYLAFAPERTVEGKALNELRTLPQVIGGFDQNSIDMAANLFREITPSIISVGSLESAEMVKLVNNSFRDLKFAFANELAMICERYNLDTTEIVLAANKGYPRDPVPVPSPGVGGPCLKKDPYIFADAAREAGIKSPLSIQGRKINEGMPEQVFKSVLRQMEKLGKNPKQSSFLLIGFAFKGEPETSDMRDSATLDVLNLLKSVAGEIRGYDPVIPPAEIEKLGILASGLEDGFAEADCVIIMNNHRSYQQLDIYANLSKMKRPAIFCDCWRIFPPNYVKQMEDITYIGLGFAV